MKPCIPAVSAFPNWPVFVEYGKRLPGTGCRNRNRIVIHKRRNYAHNFFVPYRKALGFLLKPVGRKFWEGTAGGVNAVSSAFRRLYTGNGQTYALHIVLFTMAVALLAGVFA